MQLVERRGTHGNSSRHGNFLDIERDQPRAPSGYALGTGDATTLHQLAELEKDDGRNGKLT